MRKFEERVYTYEEINQILRWDHDTSRVATVIVGVLPNGELGEVHVRWEVDLPSSDGSGEQDAELTTSAATPEKPSPDPSLEVPF